MTYRKPRSAKRSGTTVVEMAAVSTIFCMLMFGILEYCMILYTYDVMQNAAREGARFVVVNSSDATMVSDTQATVKTMMMGLDTKNTAYTCNVYLSHSSGNNVGAATNATFGQPVCVSVSLKYTPMTPGLLHLSSFTLQAKCYMSSEAN